MVTKKKKAKPIVKKAVKQVKKKVRKVAKKVIKKPAPKKKKVVKKVAPKPRIKQPRFMMAKSRPRPTGLVIALQGAKQQLRKALNAQILEYFQSGGSLKVFAPQEKPEAPKYKQPRYYNRDEYYGKR